MKEILAGITGLMMIQRGIVLGASWHGKAATVLIYGTMLVHLAWYNISPAVSNLLIVLCIIMLILSAILYAIRNAKHLEHHNRTK